jgi:predicted transcriptional regulator
MPDPDIGADGDAMVAAPCKDLRVILGVETVRAASVGEMMLARAPDRMVGRIDANVRRNVAKLSDIGVVDIAIPRRIGVIVEIAVRP